MRIAAILAVLVLPACTGVPSSNQPSGVASRTTAAAQSWP
jgi:hypothetical protein